MSCASGRATFVVVDGNRRARYDRVGYLTFAPDGRRPVYAATRGAAVFVVVDDRESAHQYEAIWMPRGQSLRFLHRNAIGYLGVRSGQIYRVEDELE